MGLRSTVESQLEKLSPRDKKLLGGLAAFFGVGALLLLTATLVGLQRSLEADVRDAKTALMTVQTKQAEFDIADARLKAQEARLKQFEDTALPAHVEALADQMGIKDGLRDAQRSEVVEHEVGVQQTKWRVVLKGRTYDEAVNFVLSLENSGYPLKIETARFKSVTVKREPAVDLTLDLYTFKLAEKQGMIRRIAVLLAGAAWAFLLFLCTGWLTFPGDAVSQRVVYEVGKSSRGSYQLELGDLSPWWVGMKTDSVKVYGKADGTGVNPLLAIATDARAAASPFSLLTRQPYVSGSITLGTDGELRYAVGTSMDEAGENLLLSQLNLRADAFPLGELLALVPAYEGGANGTFELNTAISAPDGTSSADGSVLLRGTGLSLIDPIIAENKVGRDVTIRDLDLELDVKEGTAKITRGRIVSDVANADITGTIALAAPFDRSTVDIRIEAELDPSMAGMALMLKSAEVNGKLVWRCVGRINALQRACTPGDGKAASIRAAGRTRPAATSAANRRAGNAADRPAAQGLSPEEREKRRTELQERLRKRRERRKANRDQREADRPGPGDDPSLEDDAPPDDDPIPGPDEEDLPIEEDLLDDEEFVDE